MRIHWLLASLTIAGCASDSDKERGQWTPGKGDGAFELVEAGPAVSQDIELDRRVPAFRVMSFGGTKFSIELGGGGNDGYLIVEGPLDAGGDRLAIGSGTIVAEDDDSGPGRDAKLDIELAQPGVYRVLAGTYESLGLGEAASGRMKLAIECTAKCERGGIDQKTFVRALQAQPAFAEYAKGELAKLAPSMASQLGAQLDAILADPNLAGLERFPTIPLSQVALVRPALGGLEAEAPKPDQVTRGELSMLLGACAPDRSLPAELDARPPGVRYGQFPSTVLSPCQFAHAGKLAQVLTSLAANNGSEVTFKGKTIKTPRELFAALLESGHTIQVRNERMYANFLSMIVGDKDLIWPVWLDTGIRLSNGETLTIPVGHSHHAWRISGPNVNTRVMFYLGVSGTAFFGQTDARPAWSGMIASTESAASEDVLATVEAATAYLRRNRIERTTVAAGMPADGYGYVGVCNDSNAALEHKTKGTITTFPLLRAAALDGKPDLGDGLDASIKALPNDGDGIADPRDALRRAVAMQPFADGSPLMFDAKLGAQIAVARRDVR
jgi:hypothetical protein